MKYIIRIQKRGYEACFIALCDKTRAIKVITEFWPKFNPTKYKIIIELKGKDPKYNTTTAFQAAFYYFF